MKYRIDEKQMAIAVAMYGSVREAYDATHLALRKLNIPSHQSSTIGYSIEGFVFENNISEARRLLVNVFEFKLSEIDPKREGESTKLYWERILTLYIWTYWHDNAGSNSLDEIEDTINSPLEETDFKVLVD
jgi:hypothetical protein